MTVDPVPRVIDAAEWEALEAGLTQRARALNAFVLDAYGDQRIFEEVAEPGSSVGDFTGVRAAHARSAGPGRATRDGRRDGPDPGRSPGQLLVLEDNLRMPSGATYAIAVREAVGPAFGPDCRRPGCAVPTATSSDSARRSEPPRRPPRRRTGRRDPLRRPRKRRLLRARAARPRTGAAGGRARPSCRTERGRLHARVGRERLQLDVVYRRLDEDRLTEGGGRAHSNWARSSPRRSSRTGCAASTRSAPGWPTTISPTPTSRRWSASPRRGAAAALRPQLRPLRPGGARRGDGPTRRADGRASRQLRRPPRDDHAAPHRRRAAQVIGLVRRRPEPFVAPEMVPLSTTRP